MDIENFPYSLHDEPTDEWTVEELLQWCLLQSKYKTNQKRDQIIHALQRQFEVGKREIMELHQKAQTFAEEREQEQEQDVIGDGHNGNGADQGGVEVTPETDVVDVDIDVDANIGSTYNNTNTNPACNEENVKPVDIDINAQKVDDLHHEPNKAPAKSATKRTTSSSRSRSTSQPKRTTTTTTSSSSTPNQIHIEITNGPHAGTTHLLKPQPRKPCWIGRSTSKKFLDRGISLNKDDEVSTTHGKFEFKSAEGKGRLVFTDTGSTNGTVYNGEEIADNVPLPLVNGMVLIVGGSHLLVTICD